MLNKKSRTFEISGLQSSHFAKLSRRPHYRGCLIIMPPKTPRKGRLEAKARSIRHKRPFVAAVLASALHYLCLLAAATCGTLFILNPNQQTVRALVACLVLAIVSWVIAYFRRRAAVCPLCKGTPMLHSGALPHAKAVRIPPLNHGVTAVLSTLVSQQFTCMYCGCRFDLLKESSQHVYTDDDWISSGSVPLAPLTRLPGRSHGARPLPTPPLAPIHATLHHPPQSF
jgi:hypothetical protein